MVSISDSFGEIFVRRNRQDPRVAMRWTPAGKRKRGRPKLTWRRSVEKEMKAVGWSWNQVQHWASDRQYFSSLVSALCATEHEED